MQLNEYNYNTHDRLEITVKKQLKEQVKYAYEVFGWSEYYSKEDRTYGDIEHMAFTRPHKIKCKDKLQYLQVCLEKYLDKISRSSIYKNRTSSIFFSSMCLSGVIALLFGILFIVSYVGFLSVLGYILSVLGVVIPSITLPIFIKMRRRENVRYDENIKALSQAIDKILFEAKNITEEKHEET